MNHHYWNQVMKTIYTNYNKSLHKFHLFVAELDVISSIAKVSIEHNYCKPTITDS